MKERTLNCLMGITRENYRIQQAQSFIAEVKADDSVDDETKTKLIAFADEVVEAEIKITQDGLNMVKELGGSENIEPYEEPEDEEVGGYY